MSYPYGAFGAAAAGDVGLRGLDLLERILRGREVSGQRQQALDLESAIQGLEVGAPGRAQSYFGQEGLVAPSERRLQQGIALKAAPEYPQNTEQALIQLLGRSRGAAGAETTPTPGAAATAGRAGEPGDLEDMLALHQTIKRPPLGVLDVELQRVLAKVKAGQQLTEPEQQFYESRALGHVDRDPRWRIIGQVLDKANQGLPLSGTEKELRDAYLDSLRNPGRNEAALISALAAQQNALTRIEQAATQKEVAATGKAREFREGTSAVLERIRKEVADAYQEVGKDKFAGLPGARGDEARARGLQQLLARIGAVYDREIAAAVDPREKETLRMLRDSELRKARGSQGAAGFFGDLGRKQ